MSFSHLLRRPTDVVLSSLSLAMKAISHTLPIPSKHKSDLPFAIRDLSRMLTQERGALNQSYWVAPRFLSAYVHYFLPWNLYRLAWLMPQLSIQLPEHAHIVNRKVIPVHFWVSWVEFLESVVRPMLIFQAGMVEGIVNLGDAVCCGDGLLGDFWFANIISSIDPRSRLGYTQNK